MLYAKHESGRLGSDGTIITHLKTVRAFKRNILASKYALKGVWIIYSVPREKWFSDSGHTEVARITKV